jgi:glycosyltransferase involved in cell wall biosynthesis
MKILMAVHHFPPKYTGGAEWRTYRTASYLIQRGHEVRVVSVEQIDCDPANGEPFVWMDETFEGVPIQRLCYNRTRMPDPVSGEYNNPWIGAHLAQIMRDWKPDLFHLISGYLITGSSLVAAREAGIPSVVTLTDFWFICPRISFLRSNGSLSTLPIRPATCARCLGEERRRFRYVGKVVPWLADLYWQNRTDRTGYIEMRLDFLLKELNQAGAVISPSQFLKNIYTNAGVHPDKVIFSRQGSLLAGLEQSSWVKSESPVLRIGYLGQITPIKGVHVLLEAAKKLNGAQIEVNIYGDTGPFPEYTRKLASLSKDDPRIKFRGVYSRSEVSEVFRNLDVLVVPSLWYENSPNVIIEAFAHNTPVLASRLGGMGEMVEDEKTGLLFEPGDPDDLARALLCLLDDPDLLGQLRGRINPIKSMDEEMDELEAIYSDLCVYARESL